MSDNTADKTTVRADAPEVEVEDLEVSAALGCTSTVGTISSLTS